jgi:peptide/nickel transport system permease protein
MMGTYQVDIQPAGRARRLVRANPMLVTGLALLVPMELFSLVGPLIYHTNLAAVNLAIENLPPGRGHPLGTDAYGVDVLGGLMAGGRLSLTVGGAAGLLAALIGSVWGAVAGYLGGVVDAAAMRIVDAAIAFPVIAVLLLLTAIYTPSPGALIVVIAVTSWLSTARLVRGAALTLRTREYVQAVTMMGGGRVRAIARHIAPNALGVIIVSVSLQIADAILVLATLSYLGLGVQRPSVDWGNMLASGIIGIYQDYWWEIYPAGIAIILTVVAFNLIGDGLSDWLDTGRRSRSSG